MASVTVDLDRRREHRLAGTGGRWQVRAVLRPGLQVTIINITSRAALVECEARLRPGAVTELQLSGTTSRACMRGRLDRCYVTALDPLRYRGVVMFEGFLDIEER
jgi:hypothetical protein